MRVRAGCPGTPIGARWLAGCRGPGAAVRLRRIDAAAPIRLRPVLPVQGSLRSGERRCLRLRCRRRPCVRRHLSQPAPPIEPGIRPDLAAELLRGRTQDDLQSQLLALPRRDGREPDCLAAQTDSGPARTGEGADHEPSAGMESSAFDCLSPRRSPAPHRTRRWRRPASR